MTLVFGNTGSGQSSKKVHGFKVGEFQKDLSFKLGSFSEDQSELVLNSKPEILTRTNEAVQTAIRNMPEPTNVGQLAREGLIPKITKSHQCLSSFKDDQITTDMKKVGQVVDIKGPSDKNIGSKCIVLGEDSSVKVSPLKEFTKPAGDEATRHKCFDDLQTKV